jgi:hypothetical protein
VSAQSVDVGETASVLYDLADPDDARIDTFFQLSFAPMILGGIGFVFTLNGGGGSLVALRSGAKPVARKFPTPPADPDDAPVVRTVERSARD